jgi:hypothetical protein
MAKSTEKLAAKGSLTVNKPPATPPKAAGPPPNRYSLSPKKDVEKDTIHRIIVLYLPDKTPFGYAFQGFFDAKEFLKSLSNRNGLITFFGTEEFKPFTNLTTKWIAESELGKLLWVIRIDTTMNETEGSFPVVAHRAFANKIARAVISAHIWDAGKVEVEDVGLSEHQETDLVAHFSPSFDAQREILFQEEIAEADAALEDLI